MTGITIRRNVYGEVKDIEPSQADCEYASAAWRNGCEWVTHGYWGTVTRLLLAGFCLLCSTSYGQTFKITERSSFVITERVGETAGTDREFYAVMFTAKWCGPCQQYKSSGKLERLMSRIPTTVIDVDEDPQWGIRTVPTFWLADRATKTRLKSWTGSTDAETIEREVTRIRSTKSGTTATKTTVSKSRNPSLFGRVGTSHESRSTLIRHLANDGIHRGRWTSEILESMSDDDLDAAHSADHGRGK